MKQEIKINKELYCQFLIAAQGRYSVVGLAELFSNKPAHDAFTRWLDTVKLKPRIIWEYAQKMVNLNSGYLIIDDSVLDKWYSKKIEPVYKQYSGNHHQIVNGIGVINLLWNEHKNPEQAEHIPIDLRVYDIKRDGKTKNEHCHEMLESAFLKKKFNNVIVLMDSAYSDLKTLKKIRDYKWHFIAGLKSNRQVSLNPHEFKSVADVANSSGIECHLRGYGFIKVIKTVFNKDVKYLATNNLSLSDEVIKEVSNHRWIIEEVHRGEKQTTGIENCQFRNQRAQRNHILCSTLAFLAIEKHRLEFGCSWYESKNRVIADALKQYLDKPFIPFPKNALAS